MGEGGRGAPTGFRKQLCSPVRAERCLVSGPPCRASRCLRGGPPTASAAGIASYPGDLGDAGRNRGAPGCGSEKPSQESAPGPAGPSAGKPRACAPRMEPGSGTGARETGFRTAERTGAVRLSAGWSEGEQSAACCRGRAEALTSGGAESVCGAEGVNRPRLSRSRPPLSGPFLSLLSGHFGFSSPMPLRGRVGPLGKSVFMATRSLSK